MKLSVKKKTAIIFILITLFIITYTFFMGNEKKNTLIDGGLLNDIKPRFEVQTDTRVDGLYEVEQQEEPTQFDKCLPGMIMIKGGIDPESKKKINDFCMQKMEITVSQYEKCVKQNKCKSPLVNKKNGEDDNNCNWNFNDRKRHPINCVNFNDAKIYCESIRARLPTLIEWQWVARQKEKKTNFAWGNDNPTNQLCWSGLQKRALTCPVGSFPLGNSPEGISDLNGNVAEWVSTQIKTNRDLVTYGVLGGAWWTRSIAIVRSDVLSPEVIDAEFHGNGIRCVSTVK